MPPSPSPCRRPAIVAIAALLAAAAVATMIAGCGDDADAPEPAPPDDRGRARDSAPPGDGERSLARADGPARARTLVSGLEVPWEIVFLPDGRALITERPGRIRMMTAEGKLMERPVAEVAVSALGEGGLLGLALDPEFERNQLVYTYYTTAAGMKVARYRLAGNRLRRQAVVLDGIRAGPVHDSGRIHFGPDGRLYVATGDAGQPELAQDRASLNGKFLRLEEPQYRDDRPARAQVVTLGHRNPQGFDWQPRSDRLIATEHGDVGNDEVNHIRPGENYGWPEAEGAEHAGFQAPIALYEEGIAPSGATFVSLPGSAWTGDFLIGALAGEQIRRLRFDGPEVTRDRAMFEGEFGRVRTVVEGPDGALYALTSNRDGRGSPRSGDDRVIRIVPPTD